jgi:hypothetical protein
MICGKCAARHMCSIYAARHVSPGCYGVNVEADGLPHPN